MNVTQVLQMAEGNQFKWYVPHVSKTYGYTSIRVGSNAHVAITWSIRHEDRHLIDTIHIELQPVISGTRRMQDAVDRLFALGVPKPEWYIPTTNNGARYGR